MIRSLHWIQVSLKKKYITVDSPFLSLQTCLSNNRYLSTREKTQLFTYIKRGISCCVSTSIRFNQPARVINLSSSKIFLVHQPRRTKLYRSNQEEKKNLKIFWLLQMPSTRNRNVTSKMVAMMKMRTMSYDNFFKKQLLRYERTMRLRNV